VQPAVDEHAVSQSPSSGLTTAGVVHPFDALQTLAEVGPPPGAVKMAQLLSVDGQSLVEVHSVIHRWALVLQTLPSVFWQLTAQSESRSQDVKVSSGRSQATGGLEEQPVNESAAANKPARIKQDIQRR
jgi:hypothetical protein